MNMASSNEGISTPVPAELSSTQPHSTTQGAAPRPSGRLRPNRKAGKCRYFGTKKGCRAGSSCAFVHDASPTHGQLAPSNQTESRSNQPVNAPGASSVPNVTPAPRARIVHSQFMAVPKPISGAEHEDPRNFQIKQIRLKFLTQEKTDSNGTHIKFSMMPTDPDFRFDMKELECVLHVPLGYPKQGSPSLEVLNDGLASESRELVQRRFDYIVKNLPGGTLLRWMNIFDRQLEHALTHRPPTTAIDAPSASSVPKNQKPEAQPSVGGMGDKEKASQRRRKEITQLTSRLGRDPLFKAASDGMSYTVPVRPLRADLLPSALRQIKTMMMIIPISYPLDPCRIKVPGISDESARSLETTFAEHAVKNSAMSLVAHVNFLAASMHKMAIKPTVKPAALDTVTSLPVRPATVPTPELARPAPVLAPEPARAPSPIPQVPPTEAGPSDETLPDRPHVYFIPRPPEWTTAGDGENESDMTDEESWSEDSLSDVDDGEFGGVPLPADPTYQLGKRVLLSFPDFELRGVELLTLGSLSLTLKCERCKEQCDVKNIKIGDDGISVPASRGQICGKCSSHLKIGIRREFMHPSSSRAGTLYLDGCTVVDLIPPTNFIPTCSECSTNYPAPGIAAVRGDNKMAFCRECHNRMQFKVPELKFLIVSAGEGVSQGAGRVRRKPKESLGIVAGQELPRRGRCSHYAKSYRWFRFSCCSKVFPCDRCHDAATDHPNEHANRMICGNCSREQNYRPEDCVFCHSFLVRKAGSGFWEGGKGTRNKAMMSRKDPRKYKRRGGTAVGPAQKK